MSKQAIFSSEDIMGILPHRPPFLFVDNVIGFVPHKKIETERYLRDDEFFFTGHFPQKPIMPGVLVTDALAQTSGLLWGFSKKTANNGSKSSPENPEIFFLASVNMKYVSPAFPGDTLYLTSAMDASFSGLYTFEVEAMVKHTMIAKGKLTLALMKGMV